ncbi:hypothetical protein ACU4GD_33590 [Cupriavidus basilensis]
MKGDANGQAYSENASSIRRRRYTDTSQLERGPTPTSAIIDPPTRWRRQSAIPPVARHIAANRCSCWLAGNAVRCVVASTFDERHPPCRLPNGDRGQALVSSSATSARPLRLQLGGASGKVHVDANYTLASSAASTEEGLS